MPLPAEPHGLTLPTLLLTALSFALSWIGTFFVRRFAIRINFVDKPGHRKIHSKPIALGGGIAIFAAFALPIVAVIAVAQLYRQPPALLLRMTGQELSRHWSGIHD